MCGEPSPDPLLPPPECPCVENPRLPPALPPLQAFERQVDALSRQLVKAETDAEEMVREREVLLEEMRAAQQVRGR